MKLVERVRDTITKYELCTSGDKVLIGVSGGADSLCLLLALNHLKVELGIEIGAIYIDHGLREESAEDGLFVKDVCEKLGIFYVTESVDVASLASAGLSVEEAARNLRYQALFENAKEYGFDLIAVAHNSMDQAETVLHNLFRGTGPQGLGGMRPKRERIIRPLLFCERCEIEEYLTGQDMTWREDRTNQEDHYTRNRIRHHLLPIAVDEVNSEAVAHIVQMAELLQEENDYLDRQTREAFARCYVGKNGLDLSDLRLEDPVIMKRVLFLFMDQSGIGKKDITFRHMEALCSLIEAEGTKMILLPGGKTLRKEYDRLILGEPEPAEQKMICFSLIDDPVQVETIKASIPQKKCTKWIDYDKITTALALRVRQSGDYILVDQQGHRQSMKQYMINEKIPAHMREKMLLVADGNEIVWVPGYRIGYRYRITPDTKRILMLISEEDQNG